MNLHPASRVPKRCVVNLSNSWRFHVTHALILNVLNHNLLRLGLIRTSLAFLNKKIYNVDVNTFVLYARATTALEPM